MNRAAFTVACVAAALALGAQDASAHEGQIHATDALVTGPNEITVHYSGAVGTAQEARCPECAGAFYSSAVLWPGGAREVLSVSAQGNEHTVYFGGPAVADDAQALLHVEETSWSGGGHMHELSAATVAAGDGQVPAPVGLEIALGDGRAVFEFDEKMDASHTDPARITVGGIVFAGEAVQDSDEKVAIKLDEKTRSVLSALSEIEIEAEAGAFADAAGNASKPLELEARVHADTTPPEISWNESMLDLGAGTLTLVFSEYVDSSIDSSAITVTVASQNIPLDGAEVLTRGYSDVIAVELAPHQKAVVAGGISGEALFRPIAAFYQPSAQDGPVTVKIKSGVRDAAGQSLAGGAEGGAVRVTADSIPPRVIGTPTVDLGDGSVRVKFDEHIDAYNANVSGLALISGEWSAPLSVEDAVSDGYTLIAHVDRDRWSEADTSRKIMLIVETDAVSDLSGNGVQEAIMDLDIFADRTPPKIARAEINSGDGTLTVWFDEAVKSVSGSYLALYESGKPSHRIRLADSNLTAQSGAVASVTLSEAQRADAASFPSTAVLEALGGAALDLAGNASKHSSVEVAASGDGRPPEPVSASLDGGTGTLVVEFDEPVSAESAEPKTMRLSVGGAAIPLVADDVITTVKGVERGTLSLSLHELQRQWAISHGTPLTLEMEPGAVRDTSGNAANRHVLNVVTDASDTLEPSLVSASLDLGSGLLLLYFDETTIWADPAAITLRGGDTQVTPSAAQPIDYDSSAAQLSIEQRRAVAGWNHAVLDAESGAVKDTSGNPSRAARGIEVSALPDSEPPHLVSAAPSGPDRIAVEFSEDLLDSSVSASDFRVDGESVESISEDGGIVTVVLASRISDLDGESLRVVLVGSVADKSGNVMLAHGAQLPHVDAPNDLEFIGAESFTITSDNPLSSAHAKTGDTLTVEMETDAPIESVSVTINSREADVQVVERGLAARYTVSDEDPDGPADITVEVHAPGQRGGTSVFLGSDASGNVTIDNTAPEYSSASLAGRNSLYVHYTEPVESDITQYRNIAVGDGDPLPASYVAGWGADVLVEWVDIDAGPGTHVSFEIDSSVSDLAGNVLSNPGAQDAEPPPSAEALSLLQVPGDGKVYLAHDTFVKTVSAPPGSEPIVDVFDFGPPGSPEPSVAGAGGGSVQFPPTAITVETDKMRVTFPPGVQAGGFGDKYEMVFGSSDKEPDAAFAARHPYIDPSAAVTVEMGSASRDLAFSMPILVELKGLIREESIVFSIDSDGATRELLGCAGSVNADTAAEIISSSIRPRGSTVVDGGACADKSAGAIWTTHLSAFGATVPAAASPDCDGDCTPPTLGVSSSGTRIVAGGFEYNGQAADVEEFYTPFPAVVAEVGQTNTAVLKIYDDSGPESIVHAGLAFGLREGQSISESLAEILWQNSGGAPSIAVVDPSGAIDAESIGAYHSEAPCAPGSPDSCLRLEIIHAFSGPLEFDMVGVDVWDWAGNEWQNYFEHAVHVEGEALDGKNGIAVNGGQLVLYPTVGLEIMSDGDGFLYKLAPDGEYRPLTNSSGIYRQSDESWREHQGHEGRREAEFKQAVESQTLVAMAVMERIAGGVDNPDFGKPAKLQYFEETHMGRADDTALQEALVAEQERAAEVARAAYGGT